MRAFSIIVGAVLLPLRSVGQADTAPTAIQGILLQTYALGNYVRPEFAPLGSNAGATVGANANILHYRFLQPSLDARASLSFGSTSELFLGGGPRLGMDLGRFHPYADFLVGYGLLRFANASDPTYTHNNSVVTAFGGGLDYSVNRSWAIRADVQRQDWHINHLAPNFYPVTVGVGIRYQFHFRNNTGPE